MLLRLIVLVFEEDLLLLKMILMWEIGSGIVMVMELFVFVVFMLEFVVLLVLMIEFVIVCKLLRLENCILIGLLLML